jgi:lipoate-protein ligase A
MSPPEASGKPNRDAIDSASPRSIRFHDERFPGRSAFDTAVSHAMLRRVAAGAAPESLRLYRPENVMLFSSLDARRPGYARAVELAGEAGFASAIRLAGGHAAAFLEESMAFAWAIRDEDARLRIRPRFEALAELIVAALQRLGLDARVGEIPGEYCPGEFSVNIAGRVKVMGVGQRVIRNGAHVGGVLTIAQSEQLRATLVPIYEALELDFRPETAGGIGDFDASLGVEDVVDAIQSVLVDRGVRFEPSPFDDATLAAAEELVALHEPGRSPPGEGNPLQAIGGKTLLHADQRASRDKPSPGDKK